MRPEDILKAVPLERPLYERNIVSLDELLAAEIPPRRLLLHPWLPAPGLVMLYADTGVGKSMLAYEIACCVAQGGEFLGWRTGGVAVDDGVPEPSEPRRVLYVDGEMTQGDIQRRFREVIRRYAGAEHYLDIYSADRWRQTGEELLNLGSPEGADGLLAMAEDYELVILDNYSTLVWGAFGSDDNKIESWRPMQRLLLKLRARGKTVLLIHHGGKSGDQLGTSAKRHILDTEIKLRRPAGYDPENDGVRFELHFTKARHFTGTAAAGLLVWCDLHGSVISGWHQETLANNLKHRILELAEDGMRAPMIAAELGASRGYVYKVLGKSKRT